MNEGVSLVSKAGDWEIWLQNVQQRWNQIAISSAPHMAYLSSTLHRHLLDRVVD